MILVCVVLFLWNYRAINHRGKFRFDLSGQTQSQCELTVGNKRLLVPADSGVVCVSSIWGDGWWNFAEEIPYGLTRNYRMRKIS